MNLKLAAAVVLSVSSLAMAQIRIEVRQTGDGSSTQPTITVESANVEVVGQMPAPAATQPGPGGGNVVRFAPVQQKMEKGSFLGIVASEPAPALREQLKLTPGTALVVDLVEAGSPADKAGIKLHDVLIKYNDQILILPRQLTVLIRATKVGEEVNLTILRDGAISALTAKLIEKDVPSLDNQGLLMWQGVGQNDEGIVHKPVPGVVMQGSRRAQLVTTDGGYTLNLGTDYTDGVENKTLTVKDEAGKTVFDGPVNTPEERAKLPEDVKPKLEKLDSTSRARMWNRPTPAPPPTEEPGGL